MTEGERRKTQVEKRKIRGKREIAFEMIGAKRKKREKFVKRNVREKKQSLVSGPNYCPLSESN